MSIDTISDLRVEIAEYLHREDFSDGQLDNFIDSASKRIGVLLRTDANLANQLLIALADLTGKTVNLLPSNFVEMRYVSAAIGTAPGEFRVLSPIAQTDAGRVPVTGTKPAFYYLESFTEAPGGEAAQMAVVVTPAGGSEEIHAQYWFRPTLTAASPASPVLTAYPYLYLYASIIEAHIFTQDYPQRDQVLIIYAEELKVANEGGMAARVAPMSARSGVTQRLTSNAPVRTM